MAFNPIRLAMAAFGTDDCRHSQYFPLLKGLSFHFGWIETSQRDRL